MIDGSYSQVLVKPLQNIVWGRPFLEGQKEGRKVLILALLDFALAPEIYKITINTLHQKQFYDICICKQQLSFIRKKKCVFMCAAWSRVSISSVELAAGL